MIGPARTAAISGLAGGGALLAGASLDPSRVAVDPTTMMYSLAAAALALATLVLKDRLVPGSVQLSPERISGKDLLAKLESLAFGLKEESEANKQFHASLRDRLDGIDAKISLIDVGVHTLHANQQILADESDVASWLSDSNGLCVWASKSLCNLVGYTFHEGFEGTNWINIYPSDEADYVRNRWMSAISAHVPFSMRTRYQHKDGTMIPVQVTATRLPNGSYRGVAVDLRKAKV